MKPGQASPGHLPSVFRLRVADRQCAHGRTDAVGADDEVVVAAPPVAEANRNVAVALIQMGHAHAKATARTVGGAQHERLLKLAAPDRCAGAHPAPETDQINLAERIAFPAEELESPGRCAGSLDFRSDFQAPQHLHRVGLDDNPGPHRSPGRAPLDKVWSKAAPAQGDGGRQPRNAAAYDKDVRCGRHCDPNRAKRDKLCLGLRISRPISRPSLDAFDRRVLAQSEHSIGQERTDPAALTRSAAGDIAGGDDMLSPNTHVMWSFSTQGMAPKERLAALRGLSERGTLPIEPLSGCLAEVDVCRRTYGNVGILLGTLGGLRQVVAVNAPEFADEVFLGVNIAGVAVVTHRGRELTRASGDAVLFSRPEAGFISSRPRPSLFLGLRAPRRSLAPLVANFDRASMWAIPSQSPSLRLLTDYVRLVSHSECPESSGFGHAVATHILDLIALSVGADRDAEATAAERGVRAARLQAIKADVSNRLSDGDMSVSAIAAATGSAPAMCISSSRRKARPSRNSCWRGVWNWPTAF